MDCCNRLLEDILLYRLGWGFLPQRAHLNTGSIHHLDQPIHNIELSAISGHACEFVDDGQPLSNHAVEQSWFAAVGESDERDSELLFLLVDYLLPVALFPFGFVLSADVHLLYFALVVEDELRSARVHGELSCEDLETDGLLGANFNAGSERSSKRQHEPTTILLPGLPLLN